MEQQVALEGTDALLLPFLDAKDESLSEKLITQLILEHAEPVIRRIIKGKLRVPLSASQGGQQNQDALEIAGDLRAAIFAELRELKSDPRRRAIVSFPDYVAVKTYSACADYFREKNPRRWRLKNLLRHRLKHNPRFSLWKGDDSRWYAGLSAWRETRPPDRAAEERGRVSNFDADEAVAPPHVEDAARMSPDELLAAVFESAGRPLEFDRVTAIAAAAWGVTDRPAESLEDHAGDGHAAAVDTRRGIDVAVEQRSYLTKLWAEVCQLPALQRAALLLNLRDAQGGGVIAFIPYLGIAGRAEIADALEMPGERLASLWDDLPLDDARIAGLLGLTRQQVINLRKTARERLARRMKRLEGEGESSPRSGKK